MTAPSPPWVLKVGGRELRPGPALDRFASLVARAVHTGVPTVVVHGGGDEVTERASALGLPTQRIAGQRVTDAAMLEVVIEVLGGRINHRIVTALQGAGVPAVGLSGVSGRLLVAEAFGEPTGSLGFVGRPTAVEPRVLLGMIAEGWTPVVAPLAAGPGGVIYNVNADVAAASLAARLGAHLALVTDVPAVRDAEGRPIDTLGLETARALLRAGTAKDGMIPKLEAALEAVSTGAASAWIGDLDGIARPDAARSGTRILGGPSSAAGPLPLLLTGGSER
ncbi:MAG: acetylglutamate kinase [Thermoplasmata archaeon]|nr:acetylglutamate kinase [Thermoplasmata archaeon]